MRGLSGSATFRSARLPLAVGEQCLAERAGRSYSVVDTVARCGARICLLRFRTSMSRIEKRPRMVACAHQCAPSRPKVILGDPIGSPGREARRMCPGAGRGGARTVDRAALRGPCRVAPSDMRGLGTGSHIAHAVPHALRSGAHSGRADEAIRVVRILIANAIVFILALTDDSFSYRMRRGSGDGGGAGARTAGDERGRETATSGSARSCSHKERRRAGIHRR
jgi:hypothetical protein